jgi:L-asparaginase II
MVEPTNVVEVYRGDVVESRHRVSVAVCDGQGRLRAAAGDPELVVFARSAIKPLQALPLVEDGVADALPLSQPELALCCASHSGEAYHVEAAAALLKRIGADEQALACGAHMPYHEGAANELRARNQPPSRLHNNCSGKHAGMMALARHHGWPVTGYHRLSHPVQQRMLQEVLRWSSASADAVATAVDGCGVVTFALSLRALAVSFGAFAAAARKGDSAAGRVVNAMTSQPEYVGGTGRLCTELMRVAAGRIFVKTGAEGVYLAGAPGAEVGIALKVEDGATRASEPALIAVLRALQLLSDEEVGRLERFVQPGVRNTRNEIVGFVRASIRLGAAHG